MTDAHDRSDVRGDSAAGSIPPAVGAAAAEAASELPRKAADAVQLVVDTIHDKAIRPAVLVTRVIVFGLVVAALGALLIVMASIAVVRLLDVYAFGHRVWLSYIVLGGVLTFAGLGAWTLRAAHSPAQPH